MKMEEPNFSFTILEPRSHNVTQLLYIFNTPELYVCVYLQLELNFSTAKAKVASKLISLPLRRFGIIKYVIWLDKYIYFNISI